MRPAVPTAGHPSARTLRARAGCAAGRRAAAAPPSPDPPRAVDRAAPASRVRGPARRCARGPEHRRRADSTVRRAAHAHRASCRRPRAAGARGHGSGRSPASRRARSRPPSRARWVRGCRAGGAARARARPRSAWRFRYPCRDRPAPSRPTRSRSAAGRPATWPAPTCRRRWGRAGAPHQPWAATSPCQRTTVKAISAEAIDAAQIVKASGTIVPS